jgi:hypothetical protein
LRCRRSSGGGGFKGFASFSTAAVPSSVAVAAPTVAVHAGSSSVFSSGVVCPVYSGEDSTLNVAFRRLSKKESVTKLKALAELRELMPSRSKEVVLGCLPFWAYIYPKLCLENDCRVREAAHQTFAEFVRRWCLCLYVFVSLCLYLAVCQLTSATARLCASLCLLCCVVLCYAAAAALCSCSRCALVRRCVC